MFRLTLLCLLGLTCSNVSADQGIEAIVGGHYARKGDFKYHVALYFETKQCGGAIIDDLHVLTAAHCVTNTAGQLKIQRYTVIAGTHNLHDQHDAAVVPVETVYIPKNYDPHRDLHDIAILKLQHSLNINHNHHKLEKINLPKPDAHLENVCGTIAGFGYQEIQVRKNSHGRLEEFGGQTDGKLKFLSAKIIDNQKCYDLLHRTVPSSNICAQALQENKGKHQYSGTCNGDSGGPLVYGNEIIGVLISSPLGCNESKGASMYTRVSSYLNMINSVIHGKPGSDVISANVLH